MYAHPEPTRRRTLDSEAPNCSLDGTICLAGEATVSVLDEGLVRGDGVFEVIRSYRGSPFASSDHLDRLERSGNALHLAVDRLALERELSALLDAAGAHDGIVRIVVTRAGRRIITLEPLPDRSPTVALRTILYQPDLILDGVKSLSYAANMHATRLARAQGGEEAVLFTPDGTVLEAPTAAIFWAGEDGRLRTPSVDLGILPSITRDRLLRALDGAETGRYPVEDLRSCAEAFLASTTREVQPVREIDGRAIEPGPATARAAEAFARLRDAELARTG